MENKIIFNPIARNFIGFIYGVTSSTLGGQKSISFRQYSTWYFLLANLLAKANQPFFCFKINLSASYEFLGARDSISHFVGPLVRPSVRWSHC